MRVLPRNPANSPNGPKNRFVNCQVEAVEESVILGMAQEKEAVDSEPRRQSLASPPIQLGRIERRKADGDMPV
jgi:hypothetical protein